MKKVKTYLSHRHRCEKCKELFQNDTKLKITICQDCRNKMGPGTVSADMQ